ncbi:MAG: tRNA lysidine(34) synthetase TilS [Synergistaceae bacterium]|nr:tRNA lysidine(34) synthetase TilS [Synergistaceae bacterium]
MSSEHNRLDGIKFIKALESFQLPDDGRVVVAVSGGADSVALLWFFKSFWSGEIIVAHVEHGIRGSDSREDAEFVAKLARDWGVECVIGHFDVPAQAEKGESIEMAARRVRYRFLEDMHVKYSACGVALGHNRNDTAETLLLNIFRGTGLRGMAGIPRQRGAFFRPLLGFTRDSLRSVLARNGIAWREDATNDENYYLRNKLRNIIIPQIEEAVNSQVVEHLASLSEEMSFWREKEEQIGKDLFSSLCHETPTGEKTFSIKEIRRQSASDIGILMREAGRMLNLRALSRHRIEVLSDLIRRSGKFAFQWEKNATIYAEDGELVFVIEK